FAELIEEAESGNLVESAAEDALTGLLESEAEEMKDSIAEAVSEDAEWVEFDGGSAQDYELQIGSGAFIEGFEDQLIGHVIGDTVEIRLTFPEMYYEALAGQDVVFETTIKDAYHMSKDSVLQNVTEASEVLQYPQPLLDSLTEEYMTQVRAYYNMYFPAEEETTDSSADSLAESVEEAVESAAEAVENTVSDEAMMAVLGLDAATLDTIVKTEAKLEMTARAIVAAEGVDYEEAVTTFLAEYGYESVDAVLATGATQAQLDRAVYNSAAQKAILSYQDAE
ncbi:MAG: FKBP-type peptidyl-prolyl cis-trans isomerase, partial [Lachnospiraceae bacterium]|nr:FKBP-type peptidyl-prolyl cis-trans isomerase [Lachnospiraceae bacterium]